MTAHSGDSFSGDMIFPPFVPRAAPPAPEPAPQPEPVVQPAAEPEPWAVPGSAAEAAAPDVAETPREVAEELPWLEPSVPAASGASAEAGPVADEGTGDEPATPDWLSWDPGAPAAAVTETPELPPPGDVDASAAAREVAEESGVPGLESFDRGETADVAPVDGLAPVGDFDIPGGDEQATEPRAAYETPSWAQPSEDWAAPPSEGEDPLVTAPVPTSVAAAADDEDAGDAALDPGVSSALDAEVAALLDEPEHLPIETAAAADFGDDEGEVEAVAAVAPAQPSARGDDRLSAMLGEVAERLESIARSLRDRTPAEVLAGPRDGAADPLELLVTGFVLGYLQRGGDR